MDKYICVSNKVNTVSRVALEKLGLSTKRNDPATIGQFGSGIKYAPIAALRLGLDFVFVGCDKDGEYQLRYSSQKEDGINCIVYDYGTYTKPSSFTVDAGKLSWESEFQIYREVIANAKDSGEWTRTIENKIQNTPGYFSVYITASPKMLEVFKNHDAYFCDNHKVVLQDTPLIADDKTFFKFQVLENDIPSSTRVYVKSVLAFENKHSSIFSYNFHNLELNEERSIKNTYTMEYEIYSLISRQKSKSFIRTIIDKVMDEPCDYFEFQTSNWQYSGTNMALADAFYEKYGQDAVAIDPAKAAIPGIDKACKYRGYRPIFITNSGFYHWLENSVRTLSDIAGEEVQFEIDEDITKYTVLARAVDIVDSIYPDLNIRNLNKPIGVVNNTKTEFYGMVLNSSQDISERRIVIDKTHAMEGKIDSVVATLIHETDHYYSGLSDSDPDFRDLADRRIGELMLKLYKDNDIRLENSAIIIPIKALPRINSVTWRFEYSSALSAFILNIGNCNFILKSNNIVNYPIEMIESKLEPAVINNEQVFKIDLDPKFGITTIQEVR